MDLYKNEAEKLPEELKLICALIRTEEKNTMYDNLLEEVTSHNFQWESFIEFARHHRIYPVIYERLSNLGLTTIPEEVMISLKEMYRENTFRMMRLCAELNLINELFIMNGIRTIMLKGPVLSQELFGNVTSRTSKDLDIYIPMDKIDQAEKLLKEIGYEATYGNFRVGNSWKWREHHLSYINKSKNIQIEIHWRLSPDTDKEPSFEELWERRNICYMSGKPYHLLCKEDLFMFLVWHGSRHGWFRLRWLLDIRKLLEKEIDWSFLKTLLSKYHCNHYAIQALILSSVLFDSRFPSEVGLNSKSKDKHAPFILYVFKFIENTTTKSALEVGYRKHLFFLKTRKQKIIYVLSRVFPNSWDAAAIPLPRPLHFLYFVLRPFILLWRQVKKLNA